MYNLSPIKKYSVHFLDNNNTIDTAGQDIALSGSLYFLFYHCITLAEGTI